MKKLIFLTLISLNVTAANLTWTNPTSYTDDSPLALSELSSFKLYCYQNNNLVHEKQINITPTTPETTEPLNSFEIPEGLFDCALTAFATPPAGELAESEQSNRIVVDTRPVCQFDDSIPAVDPNCPQPCWVNSSIPETDPSCPVQCPYNAGITIDDPACPDPCPFDSSIAINDVACVANPPAHYLNTYRKIMLN